MEEEKEEVISKAPDYTNLDKEACVHEADRLLGMVDAKQASKLFNDLREHLDSIIRGEREEQMHQWVEEGHEPRDFKAPSDEVKNQFYKLYDEFRDRRKREKEQAEKERQENLKQKKAILESLREIVDAEESTSSLKDVQELQHQWRQTKHVPREKMEELWETYKVLLDRFYDNVSINRELKELDRDKNLAHKIELIQKVAELKEEKNARKAFTYLSKYHEEFRNTGPVPKEHNEDIWLRFKAASDEIIQIKNEAVKELKAKQEENYQQKVLLCEKAENVVLIPAETPKEWKKKAEDLDKLFEEWKKTGPVSSAKNDEIWGRFKAARNDFYKARKSYYDALNSNREENLKKKTILCEKAESVQDSKDYKETASYLKKLQEEWKAIGPVPDKHNQKIWKRFRTACDAFFKLREINFKAKKEEELENLSKKSKLLEELKKLNEQPGDVALIKEVKRIQKEWFSIGFVPFKEKKKIESEFDKLVDALYKKCNVNKEEMSLNQKEERYSIWSASPNGARKLKQEEKNISDKIRRLQSELESYEANIQMFTLSKGSENFLKDVNKKIEKVRTGIESLQKERKLIRKHLSQHAK